MKNKLIGRRLLNARLDKRMTVQKVAMLADMPPYELKEIENGLRNLDLETCVKLAMVFDISIDFIFFGYERYRVYMPPVRYHDFT